MLTTKQESKKRSGRLVGAAKKTKGLQNGAGFTKKT